MTTAAFVRAARAADVPTLVRIQVEAWRRAYGPILPTEVCAELTSDEAADQFRQQWHEAITAPPSSRHRVLAATAGTTEREVVGLASFGPAQDPDRWPGTDAELYALHVAPEHGRAGHGSRLLNAMVDHLLEDRFTAVYAWVLAADAGLHSLLESTGWRPDGARRELDVAGTAVPMLRLHAGIEA
ncbi:GNAT family N-acetyltransferase [Lipingzhangella sp. LS1_29]|uniref:GNAT family N-acetyltransferase n=1 Tax=Lipingzhangella rawalii TaxID=2055835 RepID=A0ABU2H9K4_9ACTN|nr:GNAT family N-acetyltransferase [Lipingzhangella rawalii]MDS1271697.1 GNAT family N-acetyltransferase [Lipingzhangella rawalii]